MNKNVVSISDLIKIIGEKIDQNDKEIFRRSFFENDIYAAFQAYFALG
jgi:hypothetical protein